MKPFFLVLGLLILCAFPVSAKTYSVISIQGEEAIIRDMNGKQKIKVKKGVELDDGWVVVEVDQNAVVIEKWLSDDERVRGVLPANTLATE